jgi:O-antigen/teichoic acid export membrane protein
MPCPDAHNRISIRSPLNTTMTMKWRRLQTIFEKRALRQGVVVVLDQGFLSAATFATGAMLARATDKDDYSVYVLGLSLVFFLQGLHRALVSVPFTIYAPHLSDSDRKIYQGSTFVHTLILCIAIAGVMLAIHVSSVTARPDSNRLNESLPLLAIVAISFFLREFVRNALLARLQVWAGVRVNMIATGAQLVFTAWLFELHRLTVANTFAIAALTSLAAATYLLWRYRHLMRIVRKRLWLDLLRGLGTGKWILIDVFAYMGASQAYPWLLLYLLDNRTVAVFGVCSALAGIMGPFLRGASAYVHPRMVHGYTGANVPNLRRLVYLSSIVLGIPFGAWLLLGSMFAEQLLTLIYGHAYSGYGVLTILLLTKASIEGISSPLSQALQTLHRADVVTAGLIFGTVITLGLGSMLVVQMGLNGAGLAAAVSSAANASWKWLMLTKILRAKST